MAIDDKSYLKIDKEAFDKLPSNQKLSLLYANQIRTIDLIEDFTEIVRSYKVHQKVQYVVMAVLFIIGSVILNKLGFWI